MFQPQAHASVLAELDRLKSLGVKAVVVCFNFPLLYQPFYTFNGDPGDYQPMLAFYQQLAADIHSRGMKLIAEVGFLFPGYYSQGSGFNLDGYYATLSASQLIAAKAQYAVTVAQQIRPDFMTLGSEPDTEAQLTKQTSLDTPSGWAQTISAMLTQLRSAGVTGIPFGGGIGTWQSNGAAFLQQLCSTSLDFIDLHVYPVNLGFLDNAIAYADTAASCGKPVSIAEAWLSKVRDSELGTTNAAADPTVFSRDAFSFWAPLDQAFLGSLVKFAHWKKLLFLSAYWSRYFWSYLDYSQAQNLSANDVTVAVTQAAGAALLAGQTTSTGLFYGTTIGPPPMSVVSAANPAGFTAAPDSLVAIHGGDFSGQPQQAPLPWPASLGGASVTIQDSLGNQQPAKLSYVSGTQINAWMPAGLASGTAIVSVDNGFGVMRGTATIAPLAPAIFSANADGVGAAAGIVMRVGPDGSRVFDYTFQCGAAPGSCIPKPIGVSGDGVTVAVSLFGTGIRGASAVTATAGDTPVWVQYAGPQGQYPGFDQINLILPKTLGGAGTIAVHITADGVAANPVALAFQ